ncbi:putative late blight resistance protein R1A-10 [Capsicum chacoense]
MAAYAAVTSLMRTMHLISQSSLDLQEGNKEHLESLYDAVGSLLEFHDNSDDELMKDLQKKVKDLANDVEDEVESQVLLVREKDEHIRTEANERLLKILQQAIENIDSLKQELNKQTKNNKLQARNGSVGHSYSPQLDVSAIENNMVGYNFEQELMLRKLTGDSSEMEVISIVGMGGIGKSTFAKRLFSDPAVVSFFDVRGWITVSKDYSLRNMLLSLLQYATGVKEEINPQDQENDEEEKKKNAELADRLQKSFKGRRYLIVVDDIWCRKAWDDIRLWFPENNKASRILLTTRILEVARYASSPKDPFPMRPLEPKESWNLFCQKAFGKVDSPTKFKDVAKIVVENCNGLPLIISVVAGTLSSTTTLEEWNEVAQGVSSLVNVDDYQRCSRVLALSYNHLPSHLKSCFLYFGVFAKATEISVKKLIRLWIAEGLFEIRGHGDLEKVAGSLLHDLIDKSLVVVSKRSLDGKIKTCRIHDLLHDLCLGEAESENLLYILDPSASEPGSIVPQDRRWVSVCSYQGCFSPFLAYNKTRSVHFSEYMGSYVLLGQDHFKLLRVLDLGRLKLTSAPRELSDLVSLRYFAVRSSVIIQYLPIYKLLNLQTFSFLLDDGSPSRTTMMQLPNGIWKMSQLRHLHCRSIYLNSPPKISADDIKYRVLENLKSVTGLSPLCCTKEIFHGIKNVRKLGILGDRDEFCREPKCLDNLIYLHELEALHIEFYFGYFSYGSCRCLPQPSSFPPNLKKLTLLRTCLSWESMTIIGRLPKLEVLQLKTDAFGDSIGLEKTVWKVTDMGFPKLKFLLLEGLSLDHWRAIDDFFPCLEHIIIRKCLRLKHIPRGFADSMTLQLIELHQCSSSLVTSADRIRQEQLECLGNDILKVEAFDTIRVKERKIRATCRVRERTRPQWRI